MLTKREEKELQIVISVQLTEREFSEAFKKLLYACEETFADKCYSLTALVAVAHVDCEDAFDPPLAM